MIKQIVYILPIIFFLTSCSSVSLLNDKHHQNAEQNGRVVATDYQSEITQEVTTLSSAKAGKNYRVNRKSKTNQKKSSSIDRAEITDTTLSSMSSSSNFKLRYHKKLYNFWINYFSKREKARFLRHRKNGEKYKNLVSKIFKEHGLPEELFYLGLIESGFNTKIRSHADAVGPWQFIKGTATRYGLRVDRSIDERVNIHKSTHAAARFIKDLYNIFGNWELALCAYNAGEYRIINAIRRGNTRDYRTLVKKKLLPKETIYYIPKIAAAMELERNPRKYGLKSYTGKKTTIYDSVITKTIKHSFSLKKIASKNNISLSVLRTLNRDLRYDQVRVRSHRPVTLYIPKSKSNSKLDLNYRKYASLPKSKQGTLVSKGKHRVRRGETLWSISNKFGVTISSLKKVNKIRGSKIYKGQRLNIPRIGYKYYRVKKGDNLIAIAKKFKTTLSKLIRSNSLQSKVIHPRQKIIIPI